MSDENLDPLKLRQKEIETTLQNLEGLIASRNDVLISLEKQVLKKTVKHQFSNLNASSKGSKLSSMIIIKRNYELDLKLFRRGQFYLMKRKRRLEAELEKLKENLN